MEIAVYACGAVAVILAAILGILLYHGLLSHVVWTTFSLIVIVSLGFCLYWQNNIWKKEASAATAKQQKSAKTETKLSDEDIKKIVDGVANKLLESGQAGDALFGVIKKRIIPSMKIKHRNLYVKWETGRITKITKDKVTIQIPFMHGDIGTNKDVVIGGDKVTLYKRIGNKQCPYNFGTEAVCLEVVSLKDGIIIIRISLVKVNKIKLP